MVRVRGYALCLFAALLSACAAVPLSTMWRMRDFNVQNFFAKDPAQLRVAIRADEQTRRGDGTPMIEVRVDAAATKPLCYSFALVPVDGRAVGEPLLEFERGRRWYPFRLSEDGVVVFERARRSLRNANLEDADVRLSVSMTDVLAPAKGADRFPLRIDVAFDRSDGYFTLIKETDVLRAPEVKKEDGPARQPARLLCSGEA